MRVRGASVGLVALIAAGMAWAAVSPDELIAQRQAGYKHVGDIFKTMHDAIESGGEVTGFAGPAREVADWGRKIPSLFPPGTESGHKTHARPEIWADRAGFEKDAAALAAQADTLAQVAATGDQDAFAAQWKRTTLTCRACHESYRTKLE